MADQVKVKKVSAYPIPAKVKFSTGEVSAMIMKLAPLGFLCEIGTNQMQPGEKFEVTFELPVTHKVITEQIVSVKIYNQWSGAAKEGGTVQHLAEFHFSALTVSSKEAIADFLKRLGNPKS